LNGNTIQIKEKMLEYSNGGMQQKDIAALLLIPMFQNIETH
jgi:hypothetical protein